jgi:hypothetical protein
MSLNTRGVPFLPLDQVLAQYHSRPWPFSVLALPFCRQNIKAKMEFALALAFPVGYAVTVYQSKVPGQAIQPIRLRNVARNSVLGGLVMAAVLVC